MKAIAVVLAAGKGERHGGPKALLEWEGRPLAIAHARARLEADCARALVVVRTPVMLALLGHVTPGIDLVVSTAPDEQGPAGSLAVAAKRLAGEPRDELVIVTPVDVPPASAKTVAALIDRLNRDPAVVAARPRHGTRAGHPVVIRAGALDAYRSGTEPPVLREHLRALGARCADVDVDDASVLVNLNTPEDVAAFRATSS